MMSKVESLVSKLQMVSLKEAECLGTLASTFHGEPLDKPAIRKALDSAVFENGAVRPVYELINPGESVCILVSDHTRKTAADLVLPVLLEALQTRGCSLRDMFILFACGIHRRPTAPEVERILGVDLTTDFAGRIYFHDADNQAELVAVGRTGDGHEVLLNRRAVEADRLVLVGAATYHYHAGFGGGRKAIVPGIAARATIAYTHSLTIDPLADCIRPGVVIGALDGNRVAEAMLECARMCAPDFIVNSVLAPDGTLAGVFAGEMDIAHREACRLVEKISRVDLSRPADFVIASAGSASNWIQGHKALFNAHRAVHDKGWVILEAKCSEGLGNERFRYWVKKETLSDIYRGLRLSPEVNGQTALSTRLRAPRTVLVTQMNKEDAADIGIRTANDLASAVRMVLGDLATAGIKRPSYYVIPDAMHIVPFLGALA